MSIDIYEHRHTFEESGPFPDFAKILQEKYNNIPDHILQRQEPVIVVDAGLHEYLTSLNSIPVNNPNNQLNEGVLFDVNNYGTTNNNK